MYKYKGVILTKPLKHHGTNDFKY